MFVPDQLILVRAATQIFALLLMMAILIPTLTHRRLNLQLTIDYLIIEGYLINYTLFLARR